MQFWLVGDGYNLIKSDQSWGTETLIFTHSCHNLHIFVLMHIPYIIIETFLFTQCNTNWQQKSSVDWGPCLPAVAVSLRDVSLAHRSTKEPGFSPGISSVALGGEVLS